MNNQNVKPPLRYTSLTKGDAELIVTDNLVKLFVKGESWMGLDLNTNWQANEFMFELYEAYGVCVTTGLGLGVIQTLLTLNPKVTKVYVYEKSKEVIDIFKLTVEKNNFDISKLEIINLNADHLKNVNCDCLFLDHFEHEPEEEIFQRVGFISENNSYKLLWYWPGVRHFALFCVRLNISVNGDSYKLWKSFTKIKNLPESLTDVQIENVKQVRNVYLTLAKNASKVDIQNQRNKLISIFGSKK